MAEGASAEASCQTARDICSDDTGSSECDCCETENAEEGSQTSGDFECQECTKSSRRNVTSAEASAQTSADRVTSVKCQECQVDDIEHRVTSVKCQECQVDDIELEEGTVECEECKFGGASAAGGVEACLEDAAHTVCYCECEEHDPLEQTLQALINSATCEICPRLAQCDIEAVCTCPQTRQPEAYDQRPEDKMEPAKTPPPPPSPPPCTPPPATQPTEYSQYSAVVAKPAGDEPGPPINVHVNVQVRSSFDSTGFLEEVKRQITTAMEQAGWNNDMALEAPPEGRRSAQGARSPAPSPEYHPSVCGDDSDQLAQFRDAFSRAGVQGDEPSLPELPLKNFTRPIRRPSSPPFENVKSCMEELKLDGERPLSRKVFQANDDAYISDFERKLERDVSSHTSGHVSHFSWITKSSDDCLHENPIPLEKYTRQLGEMGSTSLAIRNMTASGESFRRFCLLENFKTQSSGEMTFRSPDISSKRKCSRRNCWGVQEKICKKKGTYRFSHHLQRCETKLDIGLWKTKHFDAQVCHISRNHIPRNLKVHAKRQKAKAECDSHSVDAQLSEFWKSHAEIPDPHSQNKGTSVAAVNVKQCEGLQYSKSLSGHERQWQFETLECSLGLSFSSRHTRDILAFMRPQTEVSVGSDTESARCASVHPYRMKFEENGFRETPPPWKLSVGGFAAGRHRSSSALDVMTQMPWQASVGQFQGDTDREEARQVHLGRNYLVDRSHVRLSPSSRRTETLPSACTSAFTPLYAAPQDAGQMQKKVGGLWKARRDIRPLLIKQRLRQKARKPTSCEVFQRKAAAPSSLGVSKDKVGLLGQHSGLEETSEMAAPIRSKYLSVNAADISPMSSSTEAVNTIIQSESKANKTSDPTELDDEFLHHGLFESNPHWTPSLVNACLLLAQEGKSYLSLSELLAEQVALQEICEAFAPKHGSLPPVEELISESSVKTADTLSAFKKEFETKDNLEKPVQMNEGEASHECEIKAKFSEIEPSGLLVSLPTTEDRRKHADRSYFEQEVKSFKDPHSTTNTFHVDKVSRSYLEDSQKKNCITELNYAHVSLDNRAPTDCGVSTNLRFASDWLSAESGVSTSLVDSDGFVRENNINAKDESSTRRMGALDTLSEVGPLAASPTQTAEVQQASGKRGLHERKLQISLRGLKVPAVSFMEWINTPQLDNCAESSELHDAEENPSYSHSARDEALADSRSMHTSAAEKGPERDKNVTIITDKQYKEDGNDLTALQKDLTDCENMQAADFRECDSQKNLFVENEKSKVHKIDFVEEISPESNVKMADTSAAIATGLEKRPNSEKPEHMKEVRTRLAVPVERGAHTRRRRRERIRRTVYAGVFRNERIPYYRTEEVKADNKLSTKHHGNLDQKLKKPESDDYVGNQDRYRKSRETVTPLSSGGLCFRSDLLKSTSKEVLGFSVGSEIREGAVPQNSETCSLKAAKLIANEDTKKKKGKESSISLSQGEFDVEVQSSVDTSNETFARCDRSDTILVENKPTSKSTEEESKVQDREIPESSTTQNIKLNTVRDDEESNVPSDQDLNRCSAENGKQDDPIRAFAREYVGTIMKHCQLKIQLSELMQTGFAMPRISLQVVTLKIPNTDTLFEEHSLSKKHVDLTVSPNTGKLGLYISLIVDIARTQAHLLTTFHECAPHQSFMPEETGNITPTQLKNAKGNPMVLFVSKDDRWIPFLLKEEFEISPQAEEYSTANFFPLSKAHDKKNLFRSDDKFLYGMELWKSYMPPRVDKFQEDWDDDCGLSNDIIVSFEHIHNLISIEHTQNENSSADEEQEGASLSQYQNKFLCPKISIATGSAGTAVFSENVFAQPARVYSAEDPDSRCQTADPADVRIFRNSSECDESYMLNYPMLPFKFDDLKYPPIDFNSCSLSANEASDCLMPDTSLILTEETLVERKPANDALVPAANFRQTHSLHRAKHPLPEKHVSADSSSKAVLSARKKCPIHGDPYFRKVKPTYTVLPSVTKAEKPKGKEPLATRNCLWTKNVKVKGESSVELSYARGDQVTAKTARRYLMRSTAELGLSKPHAHTVHDSDVACRRETENSKKSLHEAFKQLFETISSIAGCTDLPKLQNSQSSSVWENLREDEVGEMGMIKTYIVIPVNVTRQDQQFTWDSSSDWQRQEIDEGEVEYGSTQPALGRASGTSYEVGQCSETEMDVASRHLPLCAYSSLGVDETSVQEITVVEQTACKASVSQGGMRLSDSEPRKASSYALLDTLSLLKDTMSTALHSEEAAWSYAATADNPLEHFLANDANKEEEFERGFLELEEQQYQRNLRLVGNLCEAESAGSDAQVDTPLFSPRSIPWAMETIPEETSEVDEEKEHPSTCHIKYHEKYICEKPPNKFRENTGEECPIAFPEEKRSDVCLTEFQEEKTAKACHAVRHEYQTYEKDCIDPYQENTGETGLTAFHENTGGKCPVELQEYTADKSPMKVLNEHTTGQGPMELPKEYQTIKCVMDLQKEDVGDKCPIVLPKEHTTDKGPTELPEEDRTSQYSLELPEEDTTYKCSMELPKEETTGISPMELPKDHTTDKFTTELPKEYTADKRPTELPEDDRTSQCPMQFPEEDTTYKCSMELPKEDTTDTSAMELPKVDIIDKCPTELPKDHTIEKCPPKECTDEKSPEELRREYIGDQCSLALQKKYTGEKSSAEVPKGFSDDNCHMESPKYHTDDKCSIDLQKESTVDKCPTKVHENSLTDKYFIEFHEEGAAKVMALEMRDAQSTERDDEAKIESKHLSVEEPSSYISAQKTADLSCTAACSADECAGLEMMNDSGMRGNNITETLTSQAANSGNHEGDAREVNKGVPDRETESIGQQKNTCTHPTHTVCVHEGGFQITKAREHEFQSRAREGVKFSVDDGDDFQQKNDIPSEPSTGVSHIPREHLCGKEMPNGQLVPSYGVVPTACAACRCSVSDTWLGRARRTALLTTLIEQQLKEWSISDTEIEYNLDIYRINWQSSEWDSLSDTDDQLTSVESSSSLTAEESCSCQGCVTEDIVSRFLDKTDSWSDGCEFNKYLASISPKPYNRPSFPSEGSAWQSSCDSPPSAWTNKCLPKDTAARNTNAEVLGPAKDYSLASLGESVNSLEEETELSSEEVTSHPCPVKSALKGRVKAMLSLFSQQPEGISNAPSFRTEAPTTGPCSTIRNASKSPTKQSKLIEDKDYSTNAVIKDANFQERKGRRTTQKRDSKITQNASSDPALEGDCSTVCDDPPRRVQVSQKDNSSYLKESTFQTDERISTTEYMALKEIGLEYVLGL